MICRRVLTIVLVALTLVAIKLAWQIVSPTIIQTPADPSSPITVYVADYGFHSRLLLPNEDGKIVQYAYGDWQYFALKQQTPTTAFRALFVATPATLRKRVFENRMVMEASLQDRPKIKLLKLEVATDKVVALRSQLEYRFQQQLETHIEDKTYQIKFVREDRDYTVFHNSNHELVAWLQELDCQVEGFITWPNFQVRD